MNRFFQYFGRLEALVIIAGGVVMVLELVASRLLAPFVGTSLVVWSSLIGIILGALSLGYALGGRLSARQVQFQTLATLFFLAGASILFSATVKDSVLSFAAGLGVHAGSVVGITALFGIPSVLLGMISPYAIRLKVTSVEGSGEVAGRLYALSTLGSIVGTFLAGFVLIPTFGSTQLLYGLSLTLIGCSLVAGITRLNILALGLTVGLGILNGLAPSAYVYEGDTAYSHIRVMDGVDRVSQRPIRVLFLATEAHSLVYPDAPEELAADYHQLYRVDTVFVPEIKNALMIGGGAYVAPRDFLRRLPDAKMTVVEIDPAVSAAAATYFGLQPDPRLQIVHEDGRRFLNQTNEEYDVIYGDAFGSYFSIPFQLTTAEALTKMSDALSDRGVVVLNIISSLQGERSLVLQAELETLKSVFPQVYVFPVHYTTAADAQRAQNIIVVATKDPTRLSRTTLLERADAELEPWVDQLWDGPIGIGRPLPVLTDDFAPIDFYISKLL